MPALFTHNTHTFLHSEGLVPLKRWTQMLLQAVFLSPTGTCPSLVHHNKISLLPCSKPRIISLMCRSFCLVSTGQAESCYNTALGYLSSSARRQWHVRSHNSIYSLPRLWFRRVGYPDECIPDFMVLPVLFYLDTITVLINILN